MYAQVLVYRETIECGENGHLDGQWRSHGSCLSIESISLSTFDSNLVGVCCIMSDLEKKGAHETITSMPKVLPVATANPVGDVGDVGDLHKAGTKRTLKSRHAQMIAIGGTVGTGLFVGYGRASRMGGPFFLVLSYVIVPIVVYEVVTAEMSQYLPVIMSYFGKHLFSPRKGFAFG